MIASKNVTCFKRTPVVCCAAIKCCTKLNKTVTVRAQPNDDDDNKAGKLSQPCAFKRGSRTYVRTPVVMTVLQ